MYHRDTINLISVTVTSDDIGNQVETESKRLVYANEFFVGGSEYYNAAATGLRPEKRFEIYSFEYQWEEKLEHNGIKYRIIRAETKGEKTRLTCERVGADG